MFEVVLTFFKFGGIAIAAAIEIYEHFEKERSKKPVKKDCKHRNTHSYSVLLFRLKIISLTIGVLCFMGDAMKSSHDAKKAELAANEDRNAKSLILSNVLNELALQRQSIAYVERLVGTLDSLTISVTFKCLPYRKSVKKFYERVLDFKPAPYMDDKYKQDIVGIVSDRGAINTVKIGMPSERKDTLDKVMSTDWIAQNTSDIELTSFLNCLSHLQLNVALFSERNVVRHWTGADLLALTLPNSNSVKVEVTEVANADAKRILFRSNPNAPIVSVQEPSERVSLTYSFKMSASEWWHNQRISCVTDLANATLWLQVSNCPSNLVFLLQPTSLTLNFDKATIVTTNFSYDVMHRESIPITISNYNEDLSNERILSEVRRYNETNGFGFIYISQLPSHDKLVLDSWMLGE